MGTPEFATESLRLLLQNNFVVKAVVTAPDKPAGRGKKLRMSHVKELALEKGLTVLQPPNLKDSSFIEELKSFKADLFIVVAFRMLPKIVWEIPPLGCFNLHASLLPDYRGAAPINHAIINGESVTGVTTFFINEDIDTGDIIAQEKVEIKDDYNAGILHDILKVTGANLVVKTVNQICKNNISTIPQQNLGGCDLKIAPKISKDFCKINWNNNAIEIYNFIRGLSPYPGAFTILKANNLNQKMLKIFDVNYIDQKHDLTVGEILSDNKTYINIVCNNGLISVKDLQIEGKKRMKTEDFLRGNSIENYTKTEL